MKVTCRPVFSLAVVSQQINVVTSMTWSQNTVHYSAIVWGHIYSAMNSESVQFHFPLKVQ